MHNKIKHLSPDITSGTVVRITIYTKKTILLHSSAFCTQSKDIVMGVIYYGNVYFIVPNQPKAPRLALRWNDKSIEVIKTIYK